MKKYLLLTIILCGCSQSKTDQVERAVNEGFRAGALSHASVCRENPELINEDGATQVKASKDWWMKMFPNTNGTGFTIK